MMLSPEWYYEENIKGKSADEIKKEIHALKKELKGIEKEYFDTYFSGTQICPSYDVRYFITKEYLSSAMNELEKLGVEYNYTQKELKSKQINDNIKNLKEINYTHFERMPGAPKTYSLKFYDNHAELVVEELSSSKTYSNLYDKEEIVEILTSMDIGTWKNRYYSFDYGMCIMDGDSWDIELKFNNGIRTKKYHGDIMHPITYDKLVKMLEEFENEEYILK